MVAQPPMMTSIDRTLLNFLFGPRDCKGHRLTPGKLATSKLTIVPSTSFYVLFITKKSLISHFRIQLLEEIRINLELVDAD